MAKCWEKVGKSGKGGKKWEIVGKVVIVAKSGNSGEKW